MREDGKCERLRAESWGLGERVLLPKGYVVLGDVPTAYLGGPNSDGHPVIRRPHHALRRVAVDSFWMDVVEVQRADYQACLKAGRCSPARCADKSDGIPTQFEKEGELVTQGLPQTCVSYVQAEQYCRFREGTLPTLAQWTYAARGPELRSHSWGMVFDDAISLGPLPVRLQNDVSFFGMLGLSGGARELLSGKPEPDGGLAPWLKAGFRSRRGPYLRHLRQWTKRWACPNGKLDTRCIQKEARARHWVTGFRIDDTTWVWDRASQDPSLVQGPNNEAIVSLPHQDVGFRCAYTRRDSDPLLDLPHNPIEPPEFLRGENLNLFVGVAEAVNYAEAKAFCASVQLIADKERKDAGAWRLPSRDELLLVQKHRLGPGPLWTREGKAVKAVLEEKGSVKRWEEVPADPSRSALLARCVR